jgi:hypothetical protein
MPRMTESELSLLLDAHDALLAAGADERLGFVEFLAAYADFPRQYAPDAAAWPRLRTRVEFHSKVADLLSGVLFPDAQAAGLPEEAGGFLRRAALHRLRQLVARYPNFKAEAPEPTVRGKHPWPDDMMGKS